MSAEGGSVVFPPMDGAVYIPKVARDEIERLRAEVEWLWENCKIVFWQPGEVLAYPIEHDPVAGKDGRAMIEAARKAREER